MTTRLNPTNFGYQNFFSTTLTADITSGSLTLNLAAVPTPSSGILVIEPDSSTAREVVVYTSKGASTVTIPSDGRGYSGSTAAAHLSGSTVIMAPVDKWFTALASGELSTDPLRTELFYDYVASGCVWSGDAYASTRAASMTSGVIYIAGRRLTVATVSARTFTASKDTYIDASDNGDGTALLTYTEVTNNAASPALSSNNIRLGIIVTGATTIAAAGSVNQGQEDRVLPIASSIPYAVTDSLGNLICPRDPNRRILGFRQILTTFNTAATTATQITGLSCPVIVPTGRKIKISAYALSVSAGAALFASITLWDGTVGSGTQIQVWQPYLSIGAATAGVAPERILTPSATSKTYNVGLHVSTSNATLNGDATDPAYIKVELV
jgi:hypothetical protein